ncbi:Prohibitin-1, subunit of the prohibitin complex (Phb1p-Phb2p) [Tulasnella sp. 403]|nr:Prohibitin-1, subunit of the prohibitin complex (Phb1p-Phb2p) [Tulasnella sp. 403]
MLATLMTTASTDGRADESASGANPSASRIGVMAGPEVATRLFNTLGRAIGPLLIGAGVVSASIYDVPGGYRAVMFDRFSGVQPEAKNEGTHFLVPWLQRAILFDCRTKPRNISTTTGSKDLQMVSITLRVLSRPDVQHLSRVYQTLGLDYDERVLPSIGNEVLKSIVAQFDAAELITQREVVSSRIREDLLQRANEFNIRLEDVSITHLTFGKEFTVAVEAKQIAQQDAERAKFIVEKAEQERQAAVIRAEGEAEAAATISSALAKAGDAFVAFRKIEASKAIVQSLSNNKNVTYVPANSGNILLNVSAQ